MKNHLSTLSVLHYVYGGLQCFGGLFMLLLVVLGHFMNSDWMLEHAEHGPPPPFVGWFMAGLGWALFALLEVWGVLNIISGRNIKRGRGRTFSMVVAGMDCLNFPLGTGLGIYTFVTLSDAEVRAGYNPA